MRYLLAALALLCSVIAHAQTTCPPQGPNPPTGSQEVRLGWTPPTEFADGQSIPTSAVLTYTVYRQSGTTWTQLCTTTNPAGTTVTAQPVGVQTYRITAKTPAGSPPNVESVPSANASTTVPLIQVPNPPSGITISVTVVVTTP